MFKGRSLRTIFRCNCSASLRYFLGFAVKRICILSGVLQVSVLHGNLLPQERDKVMDDFRAGRTKVNNGCALSASLRSFVAYSALKVMLLCLAPW
jgi:hypothetical protein